MRTLGDRIKMLHVKDFQRSADGRKVAVIGDGVIDWPAVAQAARDIGYDGYLTLEVPGTADTADAVATRGRDALRGFGLSP
jgi:sugar phosphate isomerase/epimerase